MSAQLLPTRRDEDFRYADLTALAGVWPAAVETITVAAGESGALSVVNTGNAAMVRELSITLAAGAKFALHVLNAGSGYGRVAVRAELGEGAEFTLGAAQLGGGDQVLELVTNVSHAAPDAVSRQVVRSVVGGQATANYLGHGDGQRPARTGNPCRRCEVCARLRGGGTGPQRPVLSPVARADPARSQAADAAGLHRRSLHRRGRRGSVARSRAEGTGGLAVTLDPALRDDFPGLAGGWH